MTTGVGPSTTGNLVQAPIVVSPLRIVPGWKGLCCGRRGTTWTAAARAGPGSGPRRGHQVVPSTGCRADGAHAPEAQQRRFRMALRRAPSRDVVTARASCRLRQVAELHDVLGQVAHLPVPIAACLSDQLPDSWVATTSDQLVRVQHLIHGRPCNILYTRAGRALATACRRRPRSTGSASRAGSGGCLRCSLRAQQRRPSENDRRVGEVIGGWPGHART